MSHVQTNRIILAALVSAGAALTLVSCGDADKRQAEALYIMAETAAQEGDYGRAIELIDSIDHAHAAQIETRRKAMHLRARSTEGATVRELETTVARQARLRIAADSLQSRLTRVDNPIEPYYVASGQKRAVGENGLEARMSPDGVFYLISSLRNPKVGHTYVTVTAGGNSASTSAVAHDGERNDRSMGYEVIHYMMPECDSVGAFIASRPGEEFTVTYGGGNKSHSIVLDSCQAEGIATLYRAAQNLRQLHKATLDSLRLERQLLLSRTHAASTYSE